MPVKQRNPNFASEAEEYLYAFIVIMIESGTRFHVNTRPAFMQRPGTTKEKNRLELDLYFPTEKVAIEMQGAQHFGQVSPASGYRRTARYDEMKRKLCHQNGITLIEVLPKDLSEQGIRDKIQDHLPLIAEPDQWDLAIFKLYDGYAKRLRK